MLGKSVCILLSGKAGVGKTTSANIICAFLGNRQYAETKLSFATEVKNVARQSFGWDGNKDQEGRQLLQNIGRTGRAYDENIWVRKAFCSLVEHPRYPLDFVVVDDWRFPNEHSYILETEPLYSVYTIRVNAPNREMLLGTPEYSDISETSLDDYKFDYYVDNSASGFTAIAEKYRLILKEILEKENNFGG